MRSRWKRIRYRLEWLGLVLATKLIPLCSRRACYHIARAAGALLSFVDRPRYQVALSNLEVALGDRFSLEERRKIARESFQHFARTRAIRRGIVEIGQDSAAPDFGRPHAQLTNKPE